jgi:hypothetical protein
LTDSIRQLEALLARRESGSVVDPEAKSGIETLDARDVKTALLEFRTGW